MRKSILLIFSGVCALCVLIGIGVGYLLWQPSAAAYAAAPDELVLDSIEQDIVNPTDTQSSLYFNSSQEALYVVGIFNGYIAVYYASGGNIKEVTSTPVSALVEEEQQRLANGIPIYNDEQLVRILQDYGS